MEEGGGKKGKMSGESYSATILSAEREERMREKLSVEGMHGYRLTVH